MRGYDYEVVGDKIAEMVGDFYERELEIRDADIKRLRQQVAKLLVEMERIADVSERWEDSLVSQINVIARVAIAKATGGK